MGILSLVRSPVARQSSRYTMKDEYRIGSNEDWLQHSNEEMARLVKKRQRELALWKLVSLLLLAALVWVSYKYSLKAPLSGLWGG